MNISIDVSGSATVHAYSGRGSFATLIRNYNILSVFFSVNFVKYQSKYCLPVIDGPYIQMGPESVNHGGFYEIL